MRHKKISKRKISGDPKFHSETVAKFINYIMKKGKKSLAQNIVYKTFDILKEKTGKDPLEFFQQAINNVSPAVEIRSRRIGGANYQIPVQATEARRFVLASRWIIEAVRGRKGEPTSEKLAKELIEAANNQGSAIKKKEDVYRMAEANKAFAHFARIH